MSYRMFLNKRDPKYPVPKPGDLFKVVAVYNSTDDLMRPRADVHLEPYTTTPQQPTRPFKKPDSDP